MSIYAPSGNEAQRRLEPFKKIFILKDHILNPILKMSKLYEIRNFEKLKFVTKFHELYL